MKLDLDKKINTYMFVIIVLVFVLLFCLMCSSQMKFAVNKITENQQWEVKEEATKTTSTHIPTTTTNKYQNY